VYVSVQHRFKDPEAAFARGRRLIDGEGAPPGVRVREFHREYVDSTLGDASENSYFEVDAEQAVGLPD
jgi:hypothetical protein